MGEKGGFFFPWVSPFLLGQIWREGVRGSCALCLFECVATRSQVTFLPKGSPLLLIEYGELS